jgi:hypothetical protein
MQHDQYNLPRMTWMFIYGPNIRQGITIDREVHHVDIFATIVDILQLETHMADGKVLNDCFE